MKEAYFELLKKAKFKKHENEIWLNNIRNIKPESIYNTVVEIHKEEFAKIDCLSCANCCKTTPPLLTSEDINRISKSLGLSSKQFHKSFVLVDYNGEKNLNQVPCTFLLPDNSCSIYSIRPEACRRYPHTDELDYPKRTKLNVSNTLVCPAAFNILEKLKIAIQKI